MNQSYSLGYWTLGVQFLRLAEASAWELVKSGNPHMVVSDHGVGLEEYDDITRWSDHNIAIPILFNFYHGLELILKGFISINEPVKNSHKFSELVAKLKVLAPDSDLLKTISSFTLDAPKDSLMSEFLTINDIKIDSWYESLKYPVSTSGQEFSHYSLKYGEVHTIPFWQELASSCRLIMKQAVALAGEQHVT